MTRTGRIGLLAIIFAAASCGGGSDDKKDGPKANDGSADVASSDGPTGDGAANPDAPAPGDGAPGSEGGTAGDGSRDGGGGDAGGAATTKVGFMGGKASSADGRLTVDIPRGALVSPVDISIARVAMPAAGSLGLAFDVGPSGTRFLVPVTVTFKPLAGDLGTFAVADGRVGTLVNTTWVELDNQVYDASTGTVRGTVGHLSVFAVIGGVCRGCGTTCDMATCRFGTPAVAGKCVTRGNACSACVPVCDGDGDGYCPGAPPSDQPGGDCNDSSAAVSPGAKEICGNNVDDDCNGHVDDGCRVCTKDADCTVGSEGCTDGLCKVCDAGCDPAGCRFGAIDGMPGSGVAGRCAVFGNGCNRCVPACDMDGDGFCPGSPASDQPGGDCNDMSAAAFPGQKEICGNKIDDDCNGAVDDACDSCTKDSECPAQQRCQAGLCRGCSATCDMAMCKFGGGAVAGKCMAVGNMCNVCVPTCDGDGDGYCPGTPPNDQPGGDCQDTNASVNPAAAEICGNNVDDNCNGHIDEGCKSCTKDADCPVGFEACTDGYCGVCEGGCTENDCVFGATTPGTGVKGRCAPFGNGCLRCVPTCDKDGDGFCPGASPGMDQPGGDCDDNNAGVYPGAAEVCGDKVDQDCNGAADDGCATCTGSGTCATQQICSSGK